jgi:hypothetical protein
MANVPRHAFLFEVLRAQARPKAMTYPDWVPPAVINIAEGLFAEIKTEEDPGKAQEMLSRLSSDERMRPVWKELYKKKRDDQYRSTSKFHHPAYVTYKSIAALNRRRACELRKKKGPDNESLAASLEMEADYLEKNPDIYSAVPWSEQDIGVQLFFWHAYVTALNHKPQFLSDLQNKETEFRKIADQLREQAEATERLGELSLAQKSTQLASEYDNAARNILPKGYKPGISDDPWIIIRRRSPKVRTFVVNLSGAAMTIFYTSLYTTIAQITNVVFHRTDITGSKVREMVRLPPGV